MCAHVLRLSPAHNIRCIPHQHIPPPHLLPALTAQGTSVIFIIITNGDKGCGASFCANFTQQQIASCRRDEAVAAAASMGVAEDHVRCLGLLQGAASKLLHARQRRSKKLPNITNIHAPQTTNHRN